MKKLFCILGILSLSTLPLFAICEYNGDPKSSFNNCPPTGGILDGPGRDFDATDTGSGFMKLVQLIVERIQLIAFFIAVGIIIWIGLLMILPANAEAKEATKSKLISVLLGFLAMISASIIINALINSLYGLFQ